MVCYSGQFALEPVGKLLKRRRVARLALLLLSPLWELVGLHAFSLSIRFENVLSFCTIRMMLQELGRSPLFRIWGFRIDCRCGRKHLYFRP